MVTEIKIISEYITLGQFLKFIDIVESGTLAKKYILENDIFVNDEKEVEKRRGRKLYPNYTIKINEAKYKIIE